jgi:C4-dicarboxylate-specific signal transduction histidine kinase
MSSQTTINNLIIKHYIYLFYTLHDLFFGSVWLAYNFFLAGQYLQLSAVTRAEAEKQRQREVEEQQHREVEERRQREVEEQLKHETKERLSHEEFNNFRKKMLDISFDCAQLVA